MVDNGHHLPDQILLFDKPTRVDNKILMQYFIFKGQLIKIGIYENVKIPDEYTVMVIHPLNSFYFTDRPLKDETPQSGLFNRFHADDIQSFYCI